jgi:hypothetical protein
MVVWNPTPPCYMSLCSFVGLQLYHEIKSLTQAPSDLNHCILCRINDARRRRLQASPGTRPRVFWRPDKRCRGSNWSSEPKFGNLWHSCPQPHSRRQAPMHNPVFQFIKILLINYVSCITSRSWNEILDALNLRNHCIVPESFLHRRSANRTGRSRVISYHSRDIGVNCLLFCNHYKDDGWGHVQ